jgi:hypothetical protein
VAPETLEGLWVYAGILYVKLVLYGAVDVLAPVLYGYGGYNPVKEKAADVLVVSGIADISVLGEVVIYSGAEVSTGEVFLLVPELVKTSLDEATSLEEETPVDEGTSLDEESMVGHEEPYPATHVEVS